MKNNMRKWLKNGGSIFDRTMIMILLKECQMIINNSIENPYLQ